LRFRHGHCGRDVPFEGDYLIHGDLKFLCIEHGGTCKINI